MELQIATLGRALGDVDHEVKEVGGNNRGPRIAKILASLDPPMAEGAAWCVAWIQYIADDVAKAMGLPNPLDEVRQEALVLSYFEWAKSGGRLVESAFAKRGDLVLFDFTKGGNPWDHAGLLLSRPDPGGSFRTVEGNTGASLKAASDPLTTDRERDGDGVFVKTRKVGGSYPVAFVRWAP